MEFGISNKYTVLYVADTPCTSQEDYDKFCRRVNDWLDKHGIKLGEGTIDVLTYREVNVSDTQSYTFK